MGEWSKKIGEVGEEIVGEFLDLIGWGDSQKGLSLPCIKRTNHGTVEKPKNTHGIDYLFSHESQLTDRTNEKQDTIPVLASTVLTPAEFSFLRENQNSKEDNPKNNTRIIEWQSNNNLSESIPDTLDVGSISNPEFDNYKVIREPNFVLVENNPNHIKMDYSIERNDMSKSWATEKREFEGSLEIIKNAETNLIQIITTHTAEETKIVASKVCSKILQHFKNEGNINPSKQVEKILFSSFTNSDRIEYIFSLTKNIKSRSLEFIDIVDIKFSPDKSLDLPEEFNWIKGKVEDLKLNGKRLHQTQFFK